MAVISWEQIGYEIGKDAYLKITVQELSDGLPTGKTHFVKVGTDDSDIKVTADAKLAKLIKADRQKDIEVLSKDALYGNYNFTNLESLTKV